MSNLQHRQPSGTPTGGEFATTKHAEPDLALSGERPIETSAEVVEARLGLAASLDIPAPDVAVEISTSQGCGTPSGTSWVRLSATIPGDSLNQEVSVAFEHGPQGGTREMRCEVAWDRTPLAPMDFVRDSTTTRFQPSRRAGAAVVAQAVRDTVDQARVQRALNADVNDQQHQARLAGGQRNGRSWYDIFAMHAEVTGGQLAVTVEDRQSGSAGRKLRLDVARDGTVTGGRIDTDFGEVTLAGSDLERVCDRVDYEFACAQSRFSETSGASRGRLEARFAAVLA